MTMQFGMPSGFSDLIAKKYAIMQQSTDQQGVAINAAANLDNVRAELMPTESAANVANTRAQTTNLGLTGRTILPLMRSQIGLQGAQVRGINADIGLTRANTTSVEQLTRRRPTSALGFLGGSAITGGSSLQLGL